MAAAVAADPPSSAKEEHLPSPSPSPSLSPSPSSSPASAAKMAANAASCPAGADLPAHPAPILPRLVPSLAALPGGSHQPSGRRLPPPCWTQEETDALIQSYCQKWYALRRGNLRASHWEEVADAVARRCHHIYATAGGSNSRKTAVQCRHKMEKLRKRYRSEKRRPHRTSWVHFKDMDAMEMGTPVAAASRSKAGAAVLAPDAYSDGDNEDAESDEEEDDDGDHEDDEDDDDDDLKNGGTRSIHAVTTKTNGVAPIDDLRFQIPKAVRSKVCTPRTDERVNSTNHAFNPKPYHASSSNGFFKGFAEGLARKPPPTAVGEMRKRLEKQRQKEREGSAALGEIVAAVRMLGDGFMRVEEMKMGTAREMEKLRMEMELKRTEMILETQRWIADAFVRGLVQEKKKKPKIAPES